MVGTAKYTNRKVGPGVQDPGVKGQGSGGQVPAGAGPHGVNRRVYVTPDESLRVGQFIKIYIKRYIYV